MSHTTTAKWIVTAGGARLRLREAGGFFSRLRGLLFKPPLAPDEALLLTPCASVHTCGMGYAIDLAFLDAEGCIVKLAPALKPWRVAAAAKAHSALELTAGAIDTYRLGVGERLSVTRTGGGEQATGSASAAPRARRLRAPGAGANAQRGAALVEFLVVAPLLLLITLGMLQFGLVFHAKSNINLAAFEAARHGALKNADPAAIRNAYARALIPSYGGGQSAAELAGSRAKASAEVAIATRIEILNPTKESFADFAVMRAGKKVIPNDSLSFRSTALGATSGQHIQDANLLKLRVTHGYKPPVPLVGALMVRLLAQADKLAGAGDAFRAALLAQGRLPIVAQATVRMQSDALDSGSLVSLPGPGNGGKPLDPGPEPGSGTPPSGEPCPHFDPACSTRCAPGDPGCGESCGG